MIIYTNEGNPLALKLILCANLAKKDLIIKNVNLNDESIKVLKHLPILQIDQNDIQIFSTDSAVKYLLPNEQPIGLRDQWLEWSTEYLLPVLCSISSPARINSTVKDNLNALLKTLEDTLQSKQYITGNSLASTDLSIWSLLAVAKTSTVDLFKEYNKLSEWFTNIHELPDVKNTLEKLPLNSLNFSNLQQSNKFGGYQHLLNTGVGGDLSLMNCNKTTVKNQLASPTINNQLITDENVVEETITNEEIESVKSNFIYVNQEALPIESIVLPKAGVKNILITSALPYVNNVPHLGNIIGCVLSADIFARYSRLIGNNTLFVCGTDEYGTATETKALAENLTPKEICDKYFEIHDNIYKWFNISFNYFGRTTTEEQTRIVQEMFNELNAAGYLDIESVDQLLCTKCERYLADRFVEGTCPHPGCGYEDARGDQCDGCSKLVNAIELIRPRCKQCNSTPVVKKANQFFFNLPKIEPKIREWFETVEQGWSHNARVITKAWFREGLRPRCITRDLKWGIPVPHVGFEQKVFYVWFDAPIGYVSITNTYTKEWKQWWQPQNKDVKVSLYQFMAKDNVPFHSVMFPATLLGIDKGHTIVSHIMATEYLNYEDGKFSKSRGIGVFGNDAQDTGIAADVWRFYLAACRPEAQDSSFSWNDLVARNNSELLNNVGNFINRALVFCEKNFDCEIPAIRLTEDDCNLLALINRDVNRYCQSMDKAKLRDGIKHSLSISRLGNQYMQTQQPWVLLKGDAVQKERAGTVIAICCNVTCLLATLLYPYIPDTCDVIYKQLNITRRTLNASSPQIVQYFKSGHKIGKPSPLFVKIEQSRLDELKKKYGGAQQQQQPKQKQSDVKKTFQTVDEAENGIAEQGEKVRKLKQANPTEKTIWQPEVAILLDYKKQLTALQQQFNGVSIGKTDTVVAAAKTGTAGSGKSKKKK